MERNTIALHDHLDHDGTVFDYMFSDMFNVWFTSFLRSFARSRSHA